MIVHLLAANQSLMAEKNSSMISYVQEGRYGMPVSCTLITIGIGAISSSTSWLFLSSFVERVGHRDRGREGVPPSRPSFSGRI